MALLSRSQTQDHSLYKKQSSYNIIKSMGDCVSADRKSIIQEPPNASQITHIRHNSRIDQYTHEAIIGGQKLCLIKESEMTQKIHKNICVILWRERYGNLSRGTGLLVSKNLVLTCAHNLYNNLSRIKDELLEVYPGHCGTLERHFKVEKSFVPLKYQQKPIKGNTAYDYAILKLREDTNFSDFIGLRKHFELKQGQKIGVFGYPDDKYQSVEKEKSVETVSQWGRIKESGIIELREQKREILHIVSTLPGQSGSPLLCIEEDRITKHQTVSVIGIHTGGLRTKIKDEDVSVNVGVLLNHEIISDLQTEAKKMNATLFKVGEEQEQLFQELSANQWYQKGIEMQNNMELQAEEELKQRLICFEKAIDKEPAFVMAYCKKGFTHKKLKQYEQAIKCYQTAIKINSQNYEIYLDLGDTFRDARNYQQANKAFNKALQFNKVKERVYCSLAQVSELKNKRQEAMDYYKKAIKINPSYSDAHRGLGQIFMRINRIPSAIQSFENSVKYGDNNAESLINLGDALFAMGKNKQSIEHYKKAKEKDPNNITAYIGLGLALSRDNQAEQAIKCYREALQLSPDNYDANYELANTLRTSNKEQEATEIYKKAIQLNNNESLPYYYLANICFKTEKLQESIQYYKKSITIDENYFDSHYQLGQTYLRLGRKIEAAGCFGKCIKINPNHQEARRLLVELENQY